METCCREAMGSDLSQFKGLLRTDFAIGPIARIRGLTSAEEVTLSRSGLRLQDSYGTSNNHSRHDLCPPINHQRGAPQGFQTSTVLSKLYMFENECKRRN